MKEKSMAKRAAFFSIVGTIILIIADYFNVFSHLGVDVWNFNLEFLAIVLGNGVVILLFIIAYVMVDRRSIIKDRNKRTTALIILRGIYQHAAQIVELFEDDNMRECAARKCDFDKVLSEDPTQSFYRNLPFAEYDGTIIAFSQEGILDANELATYNDVKNKYRVYIDVSLIVREPESLASLRTWKTPLLRILNEALSKIQEELDGGNK